VIATIVLGGISIVLTGVMIRFRGNGEPERIWGRVRELEKLIRSCEATIFDHGQEIPDSNEDGEAGVKDASGMHTELLRAVDASRAELDALLNAWGR